MPAPSHEETSDDRRARRRLRRHWRKQLRAVVSELESMPDHNLIEPEDLTRFNIHISPPYLEEDENFLDFQPQFFTPLSPDQLPFSPCSQAGPDEQHHSTVPVPDSAPWMYAHTQHMTYVIMRHLVRVVLFAAEPHASSPNFQWKNHSKGFLTSVIFRC